MNVKKWNEINRFDIASVVDAILYDEQAITNLTVREIYTCVYLVKYFSDVDLSKFENDKGVLDLDATYKYLAEESDTYKEFVKQFGKKAMSDIDNMLNTQAQLKVADRLNILESKVAKWEVEGSFIDKITLLLQDLVEKMDVDKLSGFMTDITKDSNKLDLVSKLFNIGQKNETLKKAQDAVKKEKSDG